MRRPYKPIWGEVWGSAVHKDNAAGLRDGALYGRTAFGLRGEFEAAIVEHRAIGGLRLVIFGASELVHPLT
jgi:hypothetical protein